MKKTVTDVSFGRDGIETRTDVQLKNKTKKLKTTRRANGAIVSCKVVK